jgi:acyl carrier protein
MNMTPSAKMDDIKKMVGLQLGVLTVEPHARLVEDLGAESADVANLVAAVEERYQVSIKESEIAGIITVNDLFEVVVARTK